ncbi:hypothetical protein EC912_101650 [Luteibacter rhizovicinus]|uniref:Uncharacterized protein n=2 Tax=Luteibacter rhizovicinus TaxID=242606 RepID=A0A4R3Z1H9_9GAMM|nr:hypothetical protein EC912_101650 [Luteibacter rhizovicinus]
MTPDEKFRSDERRSIGFRHFARGTLLALGIAFATTAAARVATIHVHQNDDRELCAAFLNMVKAAGIQKMGDEDLCDFRFVRLSADKTTGFTFPRWEPLAVNDAASMYLRLLEGNRGRLTQPGQSQWNNLLAAIRVADAEGNVEFSSARLTIEGAERPLTFAQMDIKHCSMSKFDEVSRADGSISKEAYLNSVGVPFFGAFMDRAMSEALPVSSPPYVGGQIALWKRTIPVQLQVGHKWLAIGSDPPVQIVSLLKFRIMPASDTPYGHVNASLMSYDACDLTIRK